MADFIISKNKEDKMGLFDFLKKPKTDMEQYYETRNARETQNYGQNNDSFNPYDTQSIMDSQEFRITVQDVFNITGRGTVITGQVESGSVSVGDEVTIQRANGTMVKSVVTGIEQFRKLLNSAGPGDNVGLLLRGLSKSDISKGDVITK